MMFKFVRFVLFIFGSLPVCVRVYCTQNTHSVLLTLSAV